MSHALHPLRVELARRSEVTRVLNATRLSPFAEHSQRWITFR